CEATGSNLFVIGDGVVRTPPASAGCLLGVTRALVLELCAGNGMPAEEAALGPEALHEADEAFLTSSTREVQPVRRVGRPPPPPPPRPPGGKLAGPPREAVARHPDP